jgi:hypothetical protein
MSRSLDELIARQLRAAFRHESRRSFLSKVTRTAFAVAGVNLASRAMASVFSPLATAAQGDPAEPWTWCGLHGYICEDNCDPTKNGNHGVKAPEMVAGAWWLACCKNPQGKWQCIHYADYCGTKGPTWGDNCKGHQPSGPLWCGWGSTRVDGGYICTDVYVSGTASDDIDTCHRGCTGGDDEG